MTHLNYNATEKDQEVYILLSAIEIIDSIINKSVLKISLDKENKATIVPKNFIAEKYFFIFVNDFFSRTGDIVPKESKSIFELLMTNICEKHLMSSTEYRPLTTVVKDLETWYSSTITYKNFYFSDFNIEIPLTVSRKDSINILSNMSKHNLTRLDAVRKIIAQILRNSHSNNINAILQDNSNLITASRNFYNQFMSESSCYLVDLLIGLAFYLNKIRLEIYNYLYETYINNYIKISSDSLKRYKFNRPEGLSDVGYAYYWELMNWRRSDLLIDDFDIYDWDKDRKELPY